MKSILRLSGVFAAAALVFTLPRLQAEEPEAPPPHLGDRMIIEPGTTSVFLGKATLTVSPLHHHAGTYSGNYEVNVSPLGFASEKGDLSVKLTDDAIRRLHQKVAASFHGNATNTSGKHRTIDGRATPTGPDKGDLTLKIISERGKLVFHTTYHFAAE